MTDIEELKHVIEVLNKYNLPISPILEYAIKEKMEQLLSNDDGSVEIPVFEAIEKDGLIAMPARPIVGTKKKSSILRIVRANGTVIECKKVANAFCQAIKEVGVEKVYLLKIPMDGMHLVTIGGNPQYPSAQHDMGGGYFVNVHSNTKTKKRQLERIFSALNLNWKVEVNEPD